MKTALGGGAMMFLPWLAPSHTTPSIEFVQIISSVVGALLILARLWFVHRTQMKIIEKASAIQSADVADALHAVARTRTLTKRHPTAGGHRRRK